MPPGDTTSLDALEGDEFDGFDFGEFTQQDWDLVTEIEEKAQKQTNTTSIPELTVVVQPPSQPAPAPSIPPPATAQPSLLGARVSLFAAYRQQGSLSVSDLVGPQWCQVKFDYNLRWGNRWDRVALKPSVVITARGKRIQVKKLSAEKSESRMQAGRVSQFIRLLLEQHPQPLFRLYTRSWKWLSNRRRYTSL